MDSRRRRGFAKSRTSSSETRTSIILLAPCQKLTRLIGSWFGDEWPSVGIQMSVAAVGPVGGVCETAAE